MATRIPHNLSHIGTSEVINLPDDGIFDVPAKIDTGADGSAIWASDVQIVNGQLSFKFFAPGSVFYQNKAVITTAFKTTTVTNSFGHKETRYKIRLHVQIGEHTVIRWFSLADRSGNTFPVLLGKDFLKNKFLVDVSQKHLVSTTKQPKSVLVLSSAASANKPFFKAVAALSDNATDYKVTAYEALWFSINGIETNVINTEDQDKDIAEYGLTYFKSHNANAEFAAAAAEYLKFKNRNFVDKEVGTYISSSKLSEYMRLALHGVEIPTTVCAKTVLLSERYADLAEKLGVPFVLKEIASNRGRDNFLISNETEFKKVLEKSKHEQIFLAQQYIQNTGYLRLYVMGRDVPLAIWRDVHPHKEPLKRHLNKPAGGVNAHKIPLTQLDTSARVAAEVAAECMNRQIAGVDLIQDKATGKWYVLEVNNAPQLQTGSFLEEKAKSVAHFIEKELNR